MKRLVAGVRLALGLGLAVGLVSLVGALPATANPGGTDVVISQVYGGGGNTGAPAATLKNDFIELYNPTANAISLAGWSVQYAATAGTSWQKTDLSGSIPTGGYYLIQEAQGTGGTADLPTPNAVGTIAMAAGAGKVVLLNTNTLTTSGTACPATRIDLVGYGTTTTGCAEGTPTGTLNNATAALRNGNGATDTDSNSADFTVGTPNPRTSASINLSVNDVTRNEGNSGTTTFSFTVSLSAPAPAGGVTFDIATAPGTASSPSDYTTKSLTAQTISATSSTYTFDVLVNGDTTDEPNEAFFVNVTNVTGATVADGQGQGTILNDDANLCAAPITRIHDIQGNGAATPIPGQTVTTRGVVVGDYEGPSPTLRGFYLQAPDADVDADPMTSEGIFVFNGSNDNVNLGDSVTVTGTVSEFQDQTQVSASTVATCSTGNTVTPTDVTLPFASANFPERYEGMLVRMPQTLFVTEHFQLERFGQILMSSGGVLKEPTNVVAPGAPAIAMQAQNDLNKIIVDDPLQSQDIDPIPFGRGGNPLSASNTLRGGDTATGMVGVMTYTWAGNVASGNAFRLRPIGALGGGPPNFQPSNPRPATPPAVGGNARVGAMNLLNFFNTFGTNACTGGVGGAAMDCRGADNQAEFDRQWPKTVAAVVGLNADVVGIMEMENDGYGPTSAIRFLVDKLNAATAPGTYAFIDADAGSGQLNSLGSDAIKVGLLYKPGRVTPVGQTAVLNSVAFVNGGDSDPRSRPSLAQAFQLNSNGERFIVDANHLKSKGSACDLPDQNDGQANCNAVRVNAANALMAWLASNPTGTGDPDVLIVGDLNSYAMEDPITVIRNAGYTNLLSRFLGQDAYSYLFDGEFGYLDHALGSPSLTAKVTGVGEWHINADEPAALDYNTDFKTANLISSLYAPDQFRMSDHDPVLVGLNLNAPPTADAGGPYSVPEGGSVGVSATGNDPDNGPLTYAWDLDNNGTFETPGQSVPFSAAALDGPATRTIRVQVTDQGGLTAVSSATVNVTNVSPTATFDAPSSAFAGFPFALSLTGPSDPSAADTAAGFAYALDCGFGYGAFSPASTATCPTSAVGTRSVGGKIRDKDGGTTEYRASVDVVVTYMSLCALTETVVANADIAQALCVKLENAAAAAARGNLSARDGMLNAFRNQVDAQTGKSLSAADAAILKALSLSL